MRMLLPRRLSFTSALLVLLVSPHFTRAQQPPQREDKPDAPLPKEAVAKYQGVIDAQAPYHPITGKQRVTWTLRQTFGPESLFVGALKSGLATSRNSPEEYGPHWDGFGERYGIRFSGIAASSTIEAGLGSLWGEDPRYVRNATLPFAGRVRNVLLLAFTARNREGQRMPAYARYVAVPGNNFLSNTWRVHSDATNREALLRTAYGFLGQVAGNAWSEFWPDLKRKVFKK